MSIGNLVMAVKGTFGLEINLGGLDKRGGIPAYETWAEGLAWAGCLAEKKAEQIRLLFGDALKN